MNEKLFAGSKVFGPLNEGSSLFGKENMYTDYSFYQYSTQLSLLLVTSICCSALMMDRLNG